MTVVDPRFELILTLVMIIVGALVFWGLKDID